MILIISYGFKQYYDFLKKNKLGRVNFKYVNVNDLDLHIIGMTNIRFISLVKEINNEILNYFEDHNIKEITIEEIKNNNERNL